MFIRKATLAEGSYYYMPFSPSGCCAHKSGLNVYNGLLVRLFQLKEFIIKAAPVFIRKAPKAESVFRRFIHHELFAMMAYSSETLIRKTSERVN